MLSLVTTCERGRAAEALVLARSFLAHHPGQRVLVVLADAATAPDLHEPGVELLTGRELAPERFELLRAGLASDALARALLPAALRRAGAPALFLAPGCEVLAPVALPAVDGVVVVATGAEERGVVDDGAVALAGPGGEAVLDGWDEQVAAFDAERLIASAAARAAVRLVHDDAWAVAPWNAEARGVREVAGRLELPGGAPVVWARLDGEGPALAAAGLAHRGRVAAAELALGPVEPEPLALADGTPFDARLHRLFAEGARDGVLSASPVGEEGLVAFRRRLDEPSPDPAAGGVSRYLFDVWLSRPDLHVPYPDLRDDGDRAGFLGWAVVHGAAELPIPGWLLPADRLDELPAAPAGPRVGVNLAGYFQSELGVGEAARRVVGALDAAHVPLLPVQSRAIPPTRRSHPFVVNGPGVAPFDVNLVCVNADGLGGFAEEVGPRFFADRHTIGVWWWELPTFPEAARAAFEQLDELWVGSSWVHDAISPAAPIPVLKMPVAVPAPAVRPRSRAELGLPEGFLVLFLLDHNSVLERKNPLGLIEAFSAAFGPDDGASLVVKTINARHHPRDRQRLALAAARHPHVHLVERDVDAGERDAMLASCDLYASLHRSEGFGLTLAEAMALGRPVLATGWSGNLEFMHPETTALVPCELVPVGEGNAPYDAGSHWADPDLEAAARLMREVRAEPEAAGRRAAAAAARLLADHAPARVGAVMRARLEVLAPLVAERRSRAERRRGLPAPLETALGAAADRAGLGPEPYVPSHPSALRRGVASGALKASQQLARNQHAINATLLAATREVAGETGRLHARVDAEVAGHAELSAGTLAAQRRLEARVAELAAQVAALTEHLAAAGQTPAAAQRTVREP